MRRQRFMLGTLLVAAAIAGPSGSGPALAGEPAPGGAALAADIDPSGGSHPRQLTRVGGHVYLEAGERTSDRELWITDGFSTRRVRDIKAGHGGSRPRELTAVGHRLFFTADDGVHGRELWTSDGSARGTHLVRDLEHGPDGSFPVQLTAIGGSLLFATGLSESELWRSDGTKAGTRQLIAFPALRSRIVDLSSAHGWSWFVLLRWRPGHPGSERFSLWRSRGTTETTRRVASLGEYGFGSLSVVDHVAYLAVGGQPWISDGTAQGTHLIKAVDSEGDIPGFTPVGDRVFFTAHRYDADAADDAAGLWVTDGTRPGTRLVRIFGPGPSGTALPAELTDVQGTLYFRVDGSGTGGGDGTELWSSDGSRPGTQRVADIAQPGGSDPHGLMAFGGILFFAADDVGAGDHGVELWSSLGIGDDTSLEADINPGGDSDPSQLTKVRSWFVFTANDGAHGRELWRWYRP